MNDSQIDELIETGKPQTLRSLHELLDIPVSTSDEVLQKMLREHEGKILTLTTNQAKGDNDE